MMKMKLNKKIAGASAMLLLSTTMLGTSTFAWFTMNKDVKVTNMQVKAVAEDGLLINEVQDTSDANWDSEATTNQTAGMSLLHPSSTLNGTTWYHAASKKSNTAASATSGTKSADLLGDYSTLTGLTNISSMSNTTAAGGSTAAYETVGTAADADAGYYVHYRYYLKSAGAAVTLGGTTGNKLSIKKVEATLPQTQASSGLNPSVRVGIKLNSAFYIYAPVSGYTTSYYVNAGTTETRPIAGTTITETDLETLPAANAGATGGAPVDVYIWYEGEDAGCKSDNAQATALDNIQIDITFSLTTDDLPDNP